MDQVYITVQLVEEALSLYLVTHIFFLLDQDQIDTEITNSSATTH